MKRHLSTLCAFALSYALTAGLASNPAWSDEGHEHGAADQQEMLEMMKKMHADHQHGHDFEAMEAMSAEDMGRVMGLMMEIGLALPPMDSHRGREDLLGQVIDLDGQDLADLVAFAHDETEQHQLTAEQIPARYRELILH
jgi:hypothetical protein